MGLGLTAIHHPNATNFVLPMIKRCTPFHIFLVMHVKAEQDLYAKSGKLIQLLQQWHGSAPTMEGRLEALMIELYEKDFIEIQVHVG